MTIRQKLFLLAFISIIGLLGVYGVNIWGAKQVAELHILEVEAEEVKVSLQTIQMAQRDFYLSKKLADAQRAKDIIQDLVRRVNALGGVRPEFLQPTRQIADALQQYNAVFSDVVSAFEAQGLDQDSGLEGALRESVHKAEQLINELKDDGLRGDMLMLRRREKDFMLRGGLNYLESFNKDMTAMLARIQTSAYDESLKTQMRHLLADYQETFTQYVQVAQRVVEKRQAYYAITGDLLQYFDALIKTVHDTVEQAEGRNRNISTILTLAFILAVLGGSVVVTLSIIRSLTQLRRFAASIAEGDLQAQVDSREKGDIGALVASMRQIPAALQCILNGSRNWKIESRAVNWTPWATLPPTRAALPNWSRTPTSS